MGRSIIACGALLAAAGGCVSGVPVVDDGGTTADGGARRSVAALTLPQHFTEVEALTGLNEPTVVRFASDGRVFVAEKSGVIRVFASINATTSTVFADLRTQVHNFWDRGLLGMALHPNFPATPYVYVLYTHDAAIGGTAPRWGVAGATTDGCPNPPGATGQGCAVSARLTRLTAVGNAVSGPETVMLENWCQQFPSHSIGSINFGPEGALYLSAGDGASFNYVDYGQTGNACGDLPAGAGGTLQPATSLGGAFRSLNTQQADATRVTYDGKILRIDPITGAALPTNPLAGTLPAGRDRVVATGLRNPFRFTFRPGTSEVWIGDVGWDSWEEIDRLVSPTGALTSFGWPCYEGSAAQSGYQNLNNALCTSLAANPSQLVAPHYTWPHSATVTPGDACGTGSSSISGMAFYTNGAYPAAYRDALFFADYSRGCIFSMRAGANGLPDPALRAPFVTGAAGPVDLTVGPGGDLFYVSLSSGTIRRIVYAPTVGNRPPVARITANRLTGALPLSVTFDASGSNDPDGDALTRSWDLNGDGVFGDSTAVAPSATYSVRGSYTVRLRVTDPGGLTGEASVVVLAGAGTPTPTIALPSAFETWYVGEPLSFSGSARDSVEGVMPASSLVWQLILQHCSGGLCHPHAIQSWVGVASGSFVAPDHEYPSSLELRLTATNTAGVSTTQVLTLTADTVGVAVRSVPAGLQVSIGGTTLAAPYTHTAIENSVISVGAPSPQTLGGTAYSYQFWLDGGAQTHLYNAYYDPPPVHVVYGITAPGMLPAPWLQADVGSNALPGAAAAIGANAFALRASGTDIAGGSDGLRFVYRPLVGDGEIVARVASRTTANSLAKAGVMIRESTAANAREVSLMLAENRSAYFLRRATAGATTTSTRLTNVAVPAWVRVVRAGNVFTASYSTNGTTWTQVGTPATVAMGANTLVGLGVTSRDPERSILTTFDGVAFTQR